MPAAARRPAHDGVTRDAAAPPRLDRGTADAWPADEPSAIAMACCTRHHLALVTGVGPAIKLSTDAALHRIPTTTEADLADSARRDKPFAVAKRPVRRRVGDRVPVGRRRHRLLRARGWSPRVRAVPGRRAEGECAGIATMLRSARRSSRRPWQPRRRAIRPRRSEATDPKAAQAAAAAARAVLRGDREALLALIDPRGLVLRGRRLSRAALGKLLDGEPSETFDIDCRSPQGSRERVLVDQRRHRRHQHARDPRARGYGVIPQLVHPRQGRRVVADQARGARSRRALSYHPAHEAPLPPP